MVGSIGLVAASLFSFLHCSPEELNYGSSIGAGGGTSDGGPDSATGGNSGWVEICGNGIDDDGNGKADCEDEVCTELACVPTAPVGFLGPVAVFEGAPAELPECPQGLELAYEGAKRLSFEPAGCAGCSCGSPASTSCTAAVELGTQPYVCPLTGAPATLDSSCTTSVGAFSSLTVKDWSVTGTCASGGAPTSVTLPPATAEVGVRACALATNFGTAGCEAGAVCAPATSNSTPCVIGTGDVKCPAEFPLRSVVHAGTDEQRDCGTCPCSFSGGSCTGEVTTYLGASCNSPAFSVANGCEAWSYNGLYSMRITSSMPSGVSCNAGVAKPVGCVAATDPTTVCCAATSGPTCPVGKGPPMITVSGAEGDFCVDSTEVTREQYAEFLADAPSTATQPGECSNNNTFEPPIAWPNSTLPDDAPITHVDYCDAIAFCAWAGKRLCGAIGGGAAPYGAMGTNTAPTSQWYVACSNDGTQDFPYGTVQVEGVCAHGGSPDSVKSDVCCQGPLGGLYGLVGNVREWVDSCETGGNNPKCLTRGEQRCSEVEPESRLTKRSDLGFRCCS